jgi:hypothetical protein
VARASHEMIPDSQANVAGIGSPHPSPNFRRDPGAGGLLPVQQESVGGNHLHHEARAE